MVTEQKSIEKPAENNILKNGYFYILIALTAVGAFLRFYHLSFNSLWLDEASTYYFSNNSLMGIWNATAQGEFNPPLFYWVEHAMLFFGNNEFILRFIPALFGVTTIPLVYILGKEIADRNVGIIASVLITFSQFHIYYSQEARTYTLEVFFIVLSFLFAFKGLKRNQLWKWVLFGIFSSLAFWSHFYAIIPVIYLSVFTIIFILVKSQNKIHDLRNVFCGLIIFVLTILPLLFVMKKLFLLRTAASPAWGLQIKSLVYQTFFQMSASKVYILVLFLALFFLGMFMLFRQDKSKFVLLFLYLIVPFLFSIFLAPKIPMATRYLLYLLPIFFIGIAISYKALSGLLGKEVIIVAFIILAVVIVIPFGKSYYTSFSKEDWRGLSSDLQQKIRTKDSVVIVPGNFDKPFDYYFNNQLENVQIYEVYDLKKLEQVSDSSSNSIYYVVARWDPTFINTQAVMINWLDKNTKFIHNYNGIYLLEKY